MHWAARPAAASRVLGCVAKRRARTSPLSEWRLWTAGHRHCHRAEADDEQHRRRQAREPQDPMAPSRRIGEYRPRFHRRSVTTADPANPGNNMVRRPISPDR